MVEAAGALVEVIGDVRGEVGFLAILANYDPILLVAKDSRAKPPRALLELKKALGFEDLEAAIDLARFNQIALGEPVIEGDAELGKISADKRQHPALGEIIDAAKPGLPEEHTRARNHGVNIGIAIALRCISRQARGKLAFPVLQCRAAARQQLSGDRHDVVAAVAAGGKRKFFAAQLQIAQPDADREDVHLPAGIIDVVLAVDAMADGGEKIGNTGAVGGAVAVTHMQGAGRIGRDEFNHHGFAAGIFAAAVGAGLIQNRTKLGVVSVSCEMEVDEARAGNLGARHERALRQRRDDELRKFKWLATRSFRKLEGDVAREVAVLRVAGAFHTDGRAGCNSCDRGILNAGEGRAYKLLEWLLHRALVRRCKAGESTSAGRLEKLERVDVECPAHAAAFGQLLDGGDPARKKAMQRLAFRAFNQELRMVAAGALCHRGRHRPEEPHRARRTCNVTRSFEKFECRGRVGRRIAYRSEPAVWRPCGVLALGERRTCKTVVALGEQMAQERMFGKLSLNQYFAGLLAAPGAPG